MRRGKSIRTMLFFMWCMLLSTIIPVYASSLDSLSGTTVAATAETTSGSSSSSNRDSSALGNYLKDYNPITEDNMEVASSVASPLVNALGTISGILLVAAFGGIGTTTALDLFCIGVPALGYFITGGTPQAGVQQPVMGGYGGSYGMPQQGSQPQGSRWINNVISSEAKQAMQVTMAINQGGSPPMPMGGFGGGFSGGYGGGGYGGQQQQLATKKLVIFEYLKSRFLFVILFSVAALVLTSSALLGCGVNIAELVLILVNKLIEALSGF